MQQLNPTQAQALLQADPSALVLDVREPAELRAASLPLAAGRLLAIPMASVPMRLAEVPRTQPVVCICHHGGRSAQVVAFLERQGYAQVYNLSGGIDAWSLQVDAGVPRY